MLALICWFCLNLHSSSSPIVVQAQQDTEVKWTPNEDSEAPLPLSQNQRQQLHQLEQTIRQSPDPQGTLVQAAQANGMDPNDLVNLLQRNHEAMVQAGDIPASGGGGGGRRPSMNVWKAFSGLGVVLSSAAKSNPKTFSLFTVSLFCVIYMSIMTPRTGLVLSSNRGVISKGATTIFAPPTSYLYQLVDSTKVRQKDTTYKLAFPLSSLSSISTGPADGSKDGTAILHKLNKQSKKLFKQAVSVQLTLNPRNDDEEDDNEEDDAEEGGILQQVYFSNAQRVLDEGEFTEWIEPEDSIRMLQGENQDAVLVVKGMGDYGRYGLLFLRPVERKETMDKIEVVYSTLRGSHFDSQLHIAIEKNSIDGDSVQLSVDLITPKKGRTISKGRAKAIVQSLAASMAQSIQTRASQALARRSQSARYQGNAKARATERRQTRHRLEKEIEEMNVERRRRWQRTNPNSGSYRPSNIRQQSPNNC